MKPIKVGIIGCGFISHAHAIAAQKTDGRVKIVAATSRDKAKLSAWCAQYDAKPFENIGQMLSQIALDGVIIATPPSQHFESIALCIDAGIKAILCEKPLLTDLENCIKIKEMAASANCRVLEGFMYRHHFAFHEFIEHSKNIGKLDTIFAQFNMNLDNGKDNWRQNDKANGGIAFDFLCYPIDFCNLVANSNPKSTFAFGNFNPNSGLLEKLSGLVEYENGVTATVRVSGHSSFSQKIILSGSRGQIEMPIGFAISNHAQIVTTRTEKFIDQIVATREIAIENNDGTLTQSLAFEQQLNHFCDVIEGKMPPLCGIDHALKNLKVTLGLISSLEKRQPYEFSHCIGGMEK